MRTTYSGRTKDLDGDEIGLLGNTVSSTTNGTGDVSTVASIVNVRATDKVGAKGSATLEFSVVDVDARVNDIAISTSTSSGVVIVSVGSVVALRDTTKTPSAASLRGDGTHVDWEILLDSGDLENMLKADLGVASSKKTHLVAGSELSDGLLVESTSIGVEICNLDDLEFFLDGTVLLTAVDTTTVEITGIVDVRNTDLRVDARFEGDDVIGGRRSGNSILRNGSSHCQTGNGAENGNTLLPHVEG